MHDRQLMTATLLAATLVLTGPSARAGEAEELLERVERHHAALETMSASFTQAYRSKATGQEIVERSQHAVEKARFGLGVGRVAEDVLGVRPQLLGRGRDLPHGMLLTAASWLARITRSSLSLIHI